MGSGRHRLQETNHGDELRAQSADLVGIGLSLRVISALFEKYLCMLLL